MKRLALSMVLLISGALLATGCVYKMSMQQGNYLVTESVSQLKEGMTRSQVRFLLGTPMVPEAFDNSRWDYFYYFNSRKLHKPIKRRLTVYFEDERVQRIDNQGVPTLADVAQLDRDIQKAIADSKKNQPQKSMWKRAFGHHQPTTDTGAAGNDVTPPPKAATDEAKSTTEEAAQKPPDPVPPSQPLPAPAGMPSGQP